RALARRLDATPIVFVSEALRARFEARLGRPAAAHHAVLPMGVAPAAIDGDFATTLRARAAGRRIVTTVGRMVPIKGLDVLLAALRGRRDVVWFAAGDGPERAKLQAANDGVCTPLGPLSPAQRDALLAVSSVFAQPSRPLGRRTEGTPVALLEALRSGVPVVASATGGVPAVAAKAQALLVPPDDPAALRAAIDAVLDQPARAAEMAAAHREIGATFEWPRLGDAHLARLTAAAASPPKSRRTARWV
ncbi:MAG: glycosyltransferase family 4 protein, partial [Myxococcales bacterium]|nr:glycosyltransferase family 4 protein [Myxococcales bacterium]